MSGPIIPSVSGDYILLLSLPEARHLTIGRLGAFDFPAGVYAYVGSARGPGGLAARLRHHLTLSARPHWHVDYLRRECAMEAVWWHAGDTRLEHRWAALLGGFPGALCIAPRFGASDCTCPSHLFWLPPAFDADWLAQSLGIQDQLTPLQAPIPH